MVVLVGASLMLSAACQKPPKDESPPADRIRPAEVSLLVVDPRTPDAIASREKDPEPLTEAEVFGAHRRIEVSQGLFMARRAQEIDGDCSAAVWGQRLVDLLAESGCVQVTRAFYEQEDRKYLALTALISVSAAEDAERVAEALGGGQPIEGFVRRLPGSAPFDGFGRGQNKAYVSHLGHYVSVVWAQAAPGVEASSVDLLVVGGTSYLQLVLKDRIG